jgi:antitoxin (DNA-binding transcriptional repressor) of toxin-antitoxin stability system
MYNVQVSKRYTVSQVRQRLSDALDEAEQGVPVIIERRGVRYRLARMEEEPAKRRRRPAPRITLIDPAVADGTWTWAWTATGMAFRTARKR